MKKSEVDRILGRPIEGVESEQKKVKDNEVGAFGKIGATVLELLVGAPTKGAIKSIEGIYDAHVGAIGAIGGAFDEDFKENLGKHIAFDATGWLTDAIGYDKVEDASFLDDGKVGNFVRDVEQGIGGMAPSVALSAIPYAGAVLGPVSMGMAAGGNNMESALQNDAGYYNAWLYGVGSGVVEGATEMIGGFALGKSSTLVSKMLSGTKLGKVASSGLGELAETFISEAGEEVMSDLADPALKYATGVDKNIGENYKETIKGLPRTALLGGTIGSIMGGGSAAVAGVRNSSRGGFKASRADNSMEYISKVSKYYDKDISKHGKYDKAIDDALYDISRELTAMSKEQRANYMSTMGLYKNAFNEDGSIKSDLRADINTGAVSSNLRAISATLKHKPLSADTELTDGASKAKSYVEKMLGEGANVVVTSDSTQNNAFYNEDEGIVYINNNAAFSGEEIAAFVATHEVAHITEGTRAYGEMALMLEEIAKDPKAPAALKAKIGDIKARKKQIRDAYAGQMQGMNIAQREFLVDTELNADLVGILLGDEYFIEKLAQRDASLVEKIFNKLKALAKRDTSSTASGSPSPAGEGIKKSASVDRESAKYLSKLVNKFGRAINKSQGGVKISQLGRENEEKGAEVDEVRYSFEKYSDRQKENWKSSKNIVVFENENQYRDFIKESIENKQYKKKIYFGAISDELANIIKNQTEIDVKGFNCSLSSDEIRKIFKDHGTEKTEKPRGQRPITEDDILNVPLVIQAPEQIKKSHKLYDNKPVIDFVKNFDTKMTVSAVVSNKHLDLRVQTAFVGIKKGNLATPIDEQASINTPKASRGTVSDISISENGEKINTFDKKIDDERKSISKSIDFEEVDGGVKVTMPNPITEIAERKRAAEQEREESWDYWLNEVDKHVGSDENVISDEEYATSEREAYRESNRKDTSSTTSGPPSPQVEGYEGAMTEEDANRQAQDSLDYWVKNGDQFYGSVKYLKNGKVKVKLAQTANEVRLAKFINNNIMGKAYTNQDVKSIIDKVLTNSNIWGADDSGSYMAKLKGEDLSAVKKQLWAALNTAPEGERIGPALDIADYIVKHGILTEIVEVTEDVYYAQSIIDTLEPYKRKIDISHIKSDIEAKFDTDRTPFGLWAQKKSDTSRGFTADEVGQALEDAGIMLGGERGKLINEADIFIAMHKLYTEAQAIIKAATPTKNDIIGAYDAKEAHEIKQKIASEIMSSYEQYGKETAFSKVEKKYRGEISSLKKRVKDVHEENRLKNAVLYEAQKIKDSKAGKYHNATQVQDDSLKALKALLGKIKYRSDLNRSSVRKIINELARWYTEDNPVLQSFAVDKQTSESRGLYSPHIKALIDLFLVEDADATSSAEKPLDTTELGALNQILHHMNFVFESYGKIWRGGRWVDAPEIAKGQIAVLQEARANETVVGKLLKQGYFNFFMDPELVCARLDGADKNGYFTTLLEDLRQADIKQRHDEMLALERYDEFEKKHKKYITALMSEKNTVKVGNVIDPHAEGGATAEILEIPRYAAIDLYMVSKTRGALETFEETGWRLRLDSSKGKLDTPKATITEAQIKGIEKQFTKEDLELIEIMEEQYNVNLRRLKYETDMIRLGMSNVFDGYYYPINRISANNLDSNDFFFDLERVSNSSFNNSRVKGARNAIIVSNALTKFKKHVNGVTRYANLSIPIENMTKLLNIDVGNNANMPQSITMLLRETKDGLDAEKYIKTLIKDVQQVNIQTDGATKVVSYLRGAYAKSTLGFNPKVLFTQASSYIAGFGELRASSLAYGVAHIAKLKGLDGELDKYCPWAAVRHYEKGATRAMTVTDKISKAGDFFTMGIEFMDRQIVKLEFLACQHEAKVRYHLEIGTEENKIKAGELLMELGLKTQQNQLTTEKSAAMRSQSEFAKTLTMFKADSMKQISRFLQTINAMSVLKKKMQAARSAGDTAKYSTLEAEYKRAQKSFCKYSAVIIVSSVYMVMLARLFNKLYGREEEDENKVLGFFEDLFGNICGMIPIISELYAFFVDGYEVDSFLYSTLNNTMDAVKGTAEVVGGLVSGKNVSQEEINTNIRKLVYSIGALAGLPAKNMYKNTKAVIDLVSPSTGDKIDAWFKAPSEKSLEENIKASIEKGNDKAVSSSLELLYDKYDLKLEDAVLRREYDRLMRLEMAKAEDGSAKYSPLEAKIPSNLTVGGEEMELLKKDINTFKNAFLVAEKSQASVVKTAPYKKLKDEERAYALRKISQFYYEETKYSYTGEKSNFTYYAKVVGIEDLALILAYAKNLKGDARQSRREKIEAYIKGLGLNAVKTSLALRCLGYSDKDNDELVKGYIGRASVLSKEERAELLNILE